jgi:hypothetical protein
MTRTHYPHDRLVLAQKHAAEVRARNFPRPCECKSCVEADNLPAVLRIVAMAEKRANGQ